MGAFVQVVTGLLQEVKFRTAQDFIDSKNLAAAFFAFLGMSLLYSFGAGCLCLFEPAAAGSGIPEIKAYLNGVNLDSVVRLRVLYTKVLGMCLSVASGLPLGKEGPMIHAGSIIGAAVSQGNTITFGFDTSWTKFQDLRNDRSKRDFVTFGAAAGDFINYQCRSNAFIESIDTLEWRVKDAMLGDCTATCLTFSNILTLK